MNTINASPRASDAPAINAPSASAGPGADAPPTGQGFADLLSRVLAPAAPASGASAPARDPAQGASQAGCTAPNPASSKAEARDGAAEAAGETPEAGSDEPAEGTPATSPVVANACTQATLDPRPSRAMRPGSHDAASPRRGLPTAVPAVRDDATVDAPPAADPTRTGRARGDIAITTPDHAVDANDSTRTCDGIEAHQGGEQAAPADLPPQPFAPPVTSDRAIADPATTEPATPPRAGTTTRAARAVEPAGTAATAANAAAGANVTTPGARAVPQAAIDGLVDTAARGSETSTLAVTLPAATESAPASAAAPWPGMQAATTASGIGARTDSVAPQAHVAAPVDSSGFAPALATQVRWFVQSGVQEARMTLNPAEMGPLAVSIRLDGTQARIDFTADVAATRGAIESSLPALAAALADSGLTLAGGGVFDGSARQHGDGARRGEHGGAPGHGTHERSERSAEALRSAGSPPPRTRGLVDLVA